jgi:hypothetical protein
VGSLLRQRETAACETPAFNAISFNVATMDHSFFSYYKVISKFLLDLSFKLLTKTISK